MSNGSRLQVDPFSADSTQHGESDEGFAVLNQNRGQERIAFRFGHASPTSRRRSQRNRWRTKLVKAAKQSATSLLAVSRRKSICDGSSKSESNPVMFATMPAAAPA